MEINAPEELQQEQPLSLQQERDLANKEMNDAFNELVTMDGIINPDTGKLETTSNNIQIQVETDGIPQEPTQESSEHSEIVPDKPKRGRPPKQKEVEVDTPATDFEEEYNKLKQEYDSKVGLLDSRLKQVSSQYQELKNSVIKQEEKPEAYPDNIKEAFDLFPELQEAINYMIESKVGKITEQIKPIQEYANTAAQKEVLAPIYQAHPDVEDIVNSGELNIWANSLPAVERNGAFMIINSGSPEEVIELLDKFKHQKGITNNDSTNNSKVATLQGTSPNKDSKRGTQQSVHSSQTFEANSTTYSRGRSNGLRNSVGTSEQHSEDAIVSKVLAALNVPTTREPINLNTNPTEKEKTFEDAVREHEQQRQRRAGW